MLEGRKTDPEDTFLEDSAAGGVRSSLRTSVSKELCSWGRRKRLKCPEGVREAAVGGGGGVPGSGWTLWYASLSVSSSEGLCLWPQLGTFAGT